MSWELSVWQILADSFSKVLSSDMDRTASSAVRQDSYGMIWC